LSDARVLASVLRLNTRLFMNCLEGVAEEKAIERPSGATNSLAFVACHLVDSRHYLARYLGLDEVNPLANVLADVTSIEDVDELPPLGELKQAWRSVASVVEACVEGLSEEECRVPSRQRFPVDDPTVLGAVGFLVQHESYHIGQMALLRKYLGYPAMKYS
jgi:uncharacterized damage-inducible protein DinB